MLPFENQWLPYLFFGSYGKIVRHSLGVDVDFPFIGAPFDFPVTLLVSQKIHAKMRFALANDVIRIVAVVQNMFGYLFGGDLQFVIVKIEEKLAHLFAYFLHHFGQILLNEPV